MIPWYLMAKGKGGGGYKTASGPIVSVNDALAAPLRSLVANIEPVQEGTGDPSPDNVRPISGWSAVNVWRTGKNLFNINGRTSYIYSDVSIQNNRIVISSIGSGATSRVYFTQTYKPGTYTLSVKMSGQLETTRLFSSQPFAGGTYNAYYGGYYGDLTNGQRTVTMTEPFTIGVIAQGERGGQGEIYDIQLELSSTATPYEPYSGNQYTLQLGQTVYGGTLDVTNGVLTVDRAMKVFNGDSSEGWCKSEYNYFTSPKISDAIERNATPSDFQSNLYAYGSITNNSATLGACLIWGCVRVRLSDMSISLDDWKAQLASTPMQVVYTLATPIEIPLTPTQISTLQGQNNVWADSGDVTIEYLASGGANADLMKLAVAFMGRKS